MTTPRLTPAHSVEYPRTRSQVKRGLKAIRYSQKRAAKETDQSPGLVSGVLSGKVKSQPCLDRLGRLIVTKKQQATPGVREEVVA